MCVHVYCTRAVETSFQTVQQKLIYTCRGNKFSISLAQLRMIEKIDGSKLKEQFIRNKVAFVQMLLPSRVNNYHISNCSNIFAVEPHAHHLSLATALLKEQIK